MSDGYIQVAPDSTGKKIDNAELTRSDGTVINRQRIVMGDDTNPAEQARVLDRAISVRAGDVEALLGELLAEVKAIRWKLEESI